MAVFKPTECFPQGDSFDKTEDLPITFECRIDTSNTVIDYIYLSIYDQNGNRRNSPGYVKLSVLKQYVEENFPELIDGRENVNTGINGTYIVFPVVVSEKSTNSDIAYTQLLPTQLYNNTMYTWSIKLLQYCGGSNHPNNNKYYDMTIASGTVLGSNNNRIHSCLVASDSEVVENLLLIDKFIQPMYINNLTFPKSSSNYKPDFKNYTYDSTPVAIGERNGVKNYDSLYGYIYPYSSSTQSFSDNQITSSVSNAFRIYKNGNNIDNLSTTDYVDLIINTPVADEKDAVHTWKYIENLSNIGNSWWEETYSETSLNGYFPFGDNVLISEGQRVILNNFRDNKAVTINNIYYGSPYNGIYTPSFIRDSKEQTASATTINTKDVNIISIEFVVGYGIDTLDVLPVKFVISGKDLNEQDREYILPNPTTTNKSETSITYSWNKGIDAYGFSSVSNCIMTYTSSVVTVRWLRTNDANTWGKILNKITYVQATGTNYESSITSLGGQINSTPFKFVEERPIRLLNTANDTTETLTAKKVVENTYLYIASQNISSIISLSADGNRVSPTNYGYQIGDKIIFYTSPSGTPTSITVNYSTYREQDYTCAILYNNIPYDVYGKKIFFISPFSNIEYYMLLNPTTGEDSSQILGFDTTYNYLAIQPNGRNNYVTDKTKYLIKTYYQSSDLNSFYLYNNPTITINCYADVNQDSKIEDLNAVPYSNLYAFAEYMQNDYKLWDSYIWELYSATNELLYKTEEKYNGRIVCFFYGLENNTSYIIKLHIQTNYKKVLTFSIEITTKFKTVINDNLKVDADLDCDNYAMFSSVEIKNQPVVAPTADRYLEKDEKVTEKSLIWKSSDTLPQNIYKNGDNIIATIDKDDDGSIVGLFGNYIGLNSSRNEDLEIVYERAFNDYNLSSEQSTYTDIEVDYNDEYVYTLETQISFGGKNNNKKDFCGQFLSFYIGSKKNIFSFINYYTSSLYGDNYLINSNYPYLHLNNKPIKQINDLFLTSDNNSSPSWMNKGFGPIISSWSFLSPNTSIADWNATVGPFTAVYRQSDLGIEPSKYSYNDRDTRYLNGEWNKLSDTESTTDVVHSGVVSKENILANGNYAYISTSDNYQYAYYIDDATSIMPVIKSSTKNVWTDYKTIPESVKILFRPQTNANEDLYGNITICYDSNDVWYEPNTNSISFVNDDYRWNDGDCRTNSRGLSWVLGTLNINGSITTSTYKIESTGDDDDSYTNTELNHFQKLDSSKVNDNPSNYQNFAIKITMDENGNLLENSEDDIRTQIYQNI